MKKGDLLLSINIGLIVAYALKYNCYDKINEYKKDLTDELLTKYEDIRTERLTHFFIGVIVAIAVSLIYYIHLAPVGTPLFEKLNFALLFLLLLPIVIYMVLPKSDHMLKHSQTEQDSKDWFDIYLCMKNTTVQGFLGGFTVSMIVLSLADV